LRAGDRIRVKNARRQADGLYAWLDSPRHGPLGAGNGGMAPGFGATQVNAAGELTAQLPGRSVYTRDCRGEGKVPPSGFCGTITTSMSRAAGHRGETNAHQSDEAAHAAFLGRAAA